MKCVLIFAVAVVLIVSAGCSLERPYPDKTRYTFSIVGESQDGGGAIPGATVRVVRARVAPPYSTRSIQYRVGEYEYEPNYYHAWADDPGGLVTGAIMGGLRESGVFVGVLDAGSSMRGAMTLDVFVEELYADVRSSDRAVAVLRVTATATADDGSMMFSNSYRGDTDASSSAAGDVVDAWNRGLGRITGEVIEDIRSSRAR